MSDRSTLKSKINNGAALAFFAIVLAFTMPTERADAIMFACANGTIDSNANCVEQTTTCANVRCGSGTQCVETNTGPQCLVQNQSQNQNSCPSGKIYNPISQRCVSIVRKIKRKLDNYFNNNTGHHFGQNNHNGGQLFLHSGHNQGVAPTYYIQNVAQPTYQVQPVQIQQMPAQQMPTQQIPVQQFQVQTYQAPPLYMPTFQASTVYASPTYAPVQAQMPQFVPIYTPSYAAPTYQGW